MSTEQDPAGLRLAAGRALAVQAQPYLATALFAMKPVREPRIKTLGVDKYWRMYWNPEFVLTCSVQEVAGTWLHEVGHLLRDHNGRFAALSEPAHRHPLFNKAGDAAINHDLLDIKGISLPKIKAIYPETIPGGEAGMTAEQFYRLLCDTPAADALDPQKADLVLVPGALVVNATQGKALVGRTRKGFLNKDDLTITITDADGATYNVADAKAHDRRTLSVTVDADLPADDYALTVTSNGKSATAILRVVVPSITTRPDHIASGWTTPYNVVVAGRYTSFTPNAVVTLTDSETGAVVATSETRFVSASYLTFDITTQVADGVYRVTVSDGGETYDSVLPIGLPFLDLVPNQLDLGHGTPYPVAAVADDFTFDATTTLTVEQMTLMGPVDATGLVSPLTVRTDRAADFSVLSSLDEGIYLVTATTGDTQAVATLTVAPPQPGDDGEGSGSGEGEGEGDSDAQGNSDAKGDSDGQGDGDSDGQGDGDGSGGGSGKSDGDGNDPLRDFDDCGSGSAGPDREWDRGSDTSDGAVDTGRGNLVREQTAREIRDHAKSRGDVPGGWSRWADSILKPQVDWRKELRSVVRRTCATVAGMRDYTYSRPGRRSGVLRDVVTPALRAPRPPQVIAILDTSGSVSDKMLGQALGDIGELIKQISGGGADNLRFIACDAKATQMQSVRSLAQIDLAGGGGTDMRVGIQQAAESNPRADLIVTFTDGYTPWPDVPPVANPRAKYVAVLLTGGAEHEVPNWMHVIRVDEAYLASVRD